MKKKSEKILVAVTIIVACFTFWIYNKAPDRCPVCEGLKRHAFCIINLHSGEVGELELYMPHRKLVGEIAEEQNGGTFSFMFPAGVEAIRLTDPWELEATVPGIGKGMIPSRFCKSCRKSLKEKGEHYVLADLYDLSDPKFYRLEDGLMLSARCYELSVEYHPVSNTFTVTEIGTYGSEK